MKIKKLIDVVLVAFVYVAIVVVVNAQNPWDAFSPRTFVLTNEFGEDALIKLVSERQWTLRPYQYEDVIFSRPFFPLAVDTISHGQTKTITFTPKTIPDRYLLLIRFGNTTKDYGFYKGATFTVEKYEKRVINLQKEGDATYNIQEISSAVFNRIEERPEKVRMKEEQKGQARQREEKGDGSIKSGTSE